MEIHDMSGKIPKRAARLAVATLLCGAALSATAAAAGAAEVVYSNLPSPLPKSVASVGFEATSTSEFGGLVKFGGTARSNPKITVVMDSWACQTGEWNAYNCKTNGGARFSVPITFNVYEAGPGNSVGQKIAAASKVFKIPYRPSANTSKCTGANTGLWYSGGECVTSKSVKVTIPIKVAKLPEEAIVSVSYNTSHHGYTPTGCEPENECPEDSLNVGVTEPAEATPSTGSNPKPEYTWVNSTWTEMYEPEPHGTVGTFSYANGWTGYQPLFEVKAK
jgi:hypothetical protein